VLVRKTFRIYHHKCVWCGDTFDSESPNSRTCKPAHRTAISRWRTKLPALGEKVIGGADKPEGLIQTIGHYLDFPQSREEAIRILSEISVEINNQLNQHNIRRVR